MTAAIVALTAVLAAQPARTFLQKPEAGAIRVLTWNIYRDSIFPPEGEAVDASAATRTAQFARVVQALEPDVLCLQQVTVGAARSAALVNSILPLPDGTSWRAHGAEDTVILSRFDIAATSEGHVQNSERRRGHAIALIDTPAADLYMVCAHFQSSDGVEDVTLRRQQAEMIVMTIRDAKAGRGPIPLRPRTPFVVLGDLNAIAGPRFVDGIAAAKAVLERAGKINEGLDWDRSSLTDALPRHNATGSLRYTWRDDLDKYPPGILDRVIYSDSVLRSVNQFVLDTTSMTYEQLVKARLRTIDVMRDPQAGIHDHYPVVVDLIPRR